jgi:hypothetical protein
LGCGVLEFENNLLGAGNSIGYGCRTGPPDYIGWRNRLIGIDSWAPKKFRNTVSVICPEPLSESNHMYSYECIECQRTDLRVVT